MGIEIRLDADGFNKAITEFPAKLFGEMGRAFRQVGGEFIVKLTRERLSGAGIKSLARRTGALVGSFGRVVFGENIDSLTLSIYSDSKYAPIHEFGGTIVPRNTKYLAIPLGPAKTAAGVSRYKSPRDVPGLKFGGLSRAGNPLLRTVDGVPMYVLVKSVTIPPRLSMFTTWEQEANNIAVVLNTAIGEIIKRF